MPRKPQPDLATYGLEQVQIFDYFPTRDAALAAGAVLDPYDDTKRAKYWRDPKAAQVDPDEPLVYDVAYNSKGAAFLDGAGNPVPGKLNIMPYDAARLNIPPKGVGVFSGTASSVEIQPPIGLLPNEKLEFQPGIANAQLRVRRMDKPQAGAGSAGSSPTLADIYATLQAVQRDVKLIKSQSPGLA